jgi:hypothetical protein
VRLYRIIINILHYSQEIIFIRHDARPKPRPPQMPFLAVHEVPPLGERAQKHAHDNRKRLNFRFDKEMEMVIHKAVINQFEWMPFLYFLDNVPQQVFIGS